MRAAGGLGTLVALLGDPKAKGWHPRVLLALAAFAYDRPALEELEGMGVVPALAAVLSDGVGGGVGGFHWVDRVGLVEWWLTP